MRNTVSSKLLVVSGTLPIGHVTQRMHIAHRPNFRPKCFTMGTLQSKQPLIIINVKNLPV